KAMLQIAGSGARCRGGKVRLSLSRPYMPPIEETADENGVALFPAVMPGRYDVSLACPGHAKDEAVDEPLEVTGAIIWPLFTVHDELVIRGVVVDETGAPPEHTIDVVASPEAEERSHGSAATKAEGRFEIRGLQPGTYHLTAMRRFGEPDEP